MVAGAGAGAGARAERQLQRDVIVSNSGSLSGNLVGSVSDGVSWNVGGHFNSSNIGSQIVSGSGIRSWIAVAEQQRDRSGVGSCRLCRSVDRSVGGRSAEASAEAVAVSAVGRSIGHLVRCR